VQGNHRARPADQGRSDPSGAGRTQGTCACAEQGLRRRFRKGRSTRPSQGTPRHKEPAAASKQVGPQDLGRPSRRRFASRYRVFAAGRETRTLDRPARGRAAATAAHRVGTARKRPSSGPLPATWLRAPAPRRKDLCKGNLEHGTERKTTSLGQKSPRPPPRWRSEKEEDEGKKGVGELGPRARARRPGARPELPSVCGRKNFSSAIELGRFPASWRDWSPRGNTGPRTAPLLRGALFAGGGVKLELYAYPRAPKRLGAECASRRTTSRVSDASSNGCLEPRGQRLRGCRQEIAATNGGGPTRRQAVWRTLRPRREKGWFGPRGEAPPSSR